MAEDANYWKDRYWPRILARRLSRRRLIQLSALGGAGALAAATLGCEGKEEEAPPPAGTPTTPEVEAPPGVSKVLQEYRTRFHYSKFKDLPGQKDGPKPGGTFRFSHYQGFTGGWDVTGVEGDFLASFAPNHFNGLLTFPMDDFSDAHNLYDKIIGDLAKEWEQTDELTVTFRLNEGVKFHNLAPVNGRELTSEDVKFCAEVYKTSVPQSPIFSEVDRVETPDKYTAVFKFTQPAAYFLQSLLYPVSVIFAPEAYQDKELFNRQPIGTGAFIMEKWDPPNVYIGKKNPEYFKKDPRTGMQLPYLDGFEAPILNLNVAAEEAAFRAGDLDTIWAHFKSAFDDMLASFPDNVGQVATPPPGYQPYIALKLDKPPLNDERVRQALQHLIDTRVLIEGVAEGLADPGLAHDYSFFGREYPWTLAELIEIEVEQRPKEIWEGPGSCHFTGASDLDPWHKMPVKQMRRCTFAVYDMDLKFGKIIERL